MAMVWWRPAANVFCAVEPQTGGHFTVADTALVCRGVCRGLSDEHAYTTGRELDRFRHRSQAAGCMFSIEFLVDEVAHTMLLSSDGVPILAGSSVLIDGGAASRMA